MRKIFRLSPLAGLLLLAACTSMPTGPSALVLPGTGKNFDQFRSDDAVCRQFAYEQSGGRTAEQAAAESGVRSAAVGTVLGAVAGAAIDRGRGAETGAGVGLLMGGIAGSGAAQVSGYEAQRRYDFAYQQCMYAKGHRIPVSGRFMTEPRQSGHLSSPPPLNYPPPSGRLSPLPSTLPPGMPPPPPGVPPPPPPGIPVR